MENPPVTICLQGHTSGGGTATAYADQGGDRCTLAVGHGGHDFYPDEAWPEVHHLLKECE